MGGCTEWGAELVTWTVCQKHAHLLPTPPIVHPSQPCEGPGICSAGSGGSLIFHKHLTKDGQQPLQATISLQQLKCRQSGRGYLKSRSAQNKITSETNSLCCCIKQAERHSGQTFFFHLESYSCLLVFDFFLLLFRIFFFFLLLEHAE